MSEINHAELTDYWSAFWTDIMTNDPERPHQGGNTRHGDARCQTPGLFRYLKDRFAVKSLLDVGAGEGHAVSYFRDIGVIAHGIDALAANVKNAKHPIAQHDLTEGPYIFPCDMVYCVEVVEHVAEEYLDNLMDTLTNAPVVVMTHAVPGQPGHHHVNNQPSEYWIKQFLKRGYWPTPELLLYRDLARRDVANSYFSQTGLVFIKGSRPAPVDLDIPPYMKTPGIGKG